MKRLFFMTLLLCTVSLACAQEKKSKVEEKPTKPEMQKEVSSMLENITWLGHASFRIKGEKLVYIDPWKLKKGAEPADIILITHDHYDHLEPEDIKKIQKEGTIIVITADGAKKVKGTKKNSETWRFPFR